MYVDGGARCAPATWLPVKIALGGHSGRPARRWSCRAVSERAVRLRSVVVCMHAIPASLRPVGPHWKCCSILSGRRMRPMALHHDMDQVRA